ncbi:MAG: enoyl-CoA hydratase/isomerase family protein [Myxococcales bacterium]
MNYNHVLLEERDGIALLTVNRPEQLNALDRNVLAELERALRAIDGAPGTKGVVLTGAGEKAFVAGADIKEMAGMTPLQAQAFSRSGQRVMTSLQRMRKTVIAAVNGFALGGGLELALACDFIYAAEGAKLGAREVALGVIPGFGGTQNLARLVGPNRARELVLTGKIFTAQEAKDWGVVNQVLPKGELVPAALATARQITSNSLVAVAAAKDAIASGLDMAREDGLRYEATLFGGLFGSEDQREGMSAFLEKRKATFKQDLEEHA